MGVYEDWVAKNPSRSVKTVSNIEFILKSLDFFVDLVRKEGEVLARNTAHGSQEYLTGSGNWVVPTGVYEILVDMIGGGGGGGGGGSGSNTSGNNGGGGGGGGAGEVRRDIFFAVTPGQSIPYIVGVGGTAGIGAVSTGNGGGGGRGRDTVFNRVLACGGGGGGGGNAYGVTGTYFGNGGIGYNNGVDLFLGSSGSTSFMATSFASGGTGGVAMGVSGGDGGGIGGGKGAYGAQSAPAAAGGVGEVNTGSGGGGGNGAATANFNGGNGGVGGSGRITIRW